MRQNVCEEYLEQKGIHVKSAMKYAGDELEQYIHLLDVFTARKNHERQEALQKAYRTQNWKDYTTYVHGLKNGARTIGADELANIAYVHEQKSKEGDIAYVHENFQTLMQEWKKTEEIISSYLKIYYKENYYKEMLQDRLGESGVTEAVRKEALEQVIHYLAEYKKKEALALLKKLADDKFAEEKRNHLERAIRAVQEYDYECAIHILREI